jgi:hypothetical protein
MQAMVSDKDKDLLMTVIPDRGLYTLVIQHALKRTADYIRINSLTFASTDDQRDLLAYVTHPCDSIRGRAAVGATWGNPTTSAHRTNRGLW